MIRKTHKLKSLVALWAVLFGLAFTTVSFYDFNPKLLFVEITEEKGEDGGDANEEGGDSILSFETIFHESKIVFVINANFTNSIHAHKVCSTCSGYTLALIKPPLAV